MTFNNTQEAYEDLRNIVAERTDSLIAWVGAGLSTEAQLPGWSSLRQRLVQALRKTSEPLTNEDEVRIILSMCEAAENSSNLWDAFSILQKGLGKEEYRASIRKAFAPSDIAPVPESYRRLWKLGVTGIITLNIDRLVSRAFSEVNQGKLLNDFAIGEVKQQIHVLKSGKPWTCYLHGMLENASSWVFTGNELERLQKDDGYQTLLSLSFSARTVVFIGISADDIAAGGHLEKMTRKGFDFGGHFWITHRDDLKTREWASRAGLRLIIYDAADGDHSKLYELFDDLAAFVSVDDDPQPVLPTGIRIPSHPLPSPEELESKSAVELRTVLNAEAQKILSTASVDMLATFNNFAAKYAEPIYRAWFVSLDAPKNDLLGYKISEKVAEGAFGTVYRATDATGAQFAIKVLHERVRDKPEMLHSFRRGVRSMRILTEGNVPGVVRYHNASEIPAMVVMDFIEGINLSDAVRKGVLRNWHQLLLVATELTKIIRHSHKLPQRVLHRDIRPTNVMLENCWGPDPNWEDVAIYLLDFDLSWHLDAFDLSVSEPGTSNGYLAPEQVHRSKGTSTRNAAVDSFGLGMTLYFLRSRVEPRFGQHRYGDWLETLYSCAEKHPCKEWMSLPQRYVRLIHNATMERQEQRWDMSRIEGELDRLREAQAGLLPVQSAELLAEEIGARAFKGRYEWDDDASTATYKVGGTCINISGDERSRKVIVEFNWLKGGDDNNQSVKKWLPNAKNKILSLFNNAGWRCTGMINTGQLNGKAEIDVDVVKKNLQHAATALNASLHALNFR